MVKTKFVTQSDMKIGLIGDEDTAWNPALSLVWSSFLWKPSSFGLIL